jgi:hypothetical protein
VKFATTRVTIRVSESTGKEKEKRNGVGGQICLSSRSEEAGNNSFINLLLYIVRAMDSHQAKQ